MALPSDRDLHDDGLDSSNLEVGHGDFEPALGEVPDGLGADLYAQRLERLSKEEAFGEGVLSFSDAEGVEQDIRLDDVAGTEHDHGSNRTKILLRSGAAVVVTGAVIAGAVAALRYRRKHKA